MDPLISNAASQLAHGLNDPRRVLGTRTPADREEVRRVAQEFEAVFLAQMLSHMWEGVPTDGLFGGGHAEETWRTMLMSEYGKLIARSGGVGIAEQVERQLIALQEV